MRHVRDRRIVGLVFLALAWAITIGGVMLTRSVAPDGDQYRIAGFAIGEGYERTVIPRRALDCTNPAGDRHRERCSIMLDGRTLVAEVARDDHTFDFPTCLVRHGEREGSCWASNSTVSGPTYAAMSRVGLGLSEATLADLDRQQPFANWREADWLRGGTLATTIIAVCLALAALLLLPQRLPIRALGAFCLGGLVWGFGWFFAPFTLLGAGLID